MAAVFRSTVLMLAVVGCAPAETATVTEVPPQELPTPAVGVQTNPQLPPADASLMHAGEEWVGTYVCAQGTTDLTLRVERVMGSSVDAVFDFSHGPSGVAGRYRMRGTLNPDGTAHFVPGPWIDQPDGYISVGMTGRVQGGGFAGRMDHRSCRQFSVQRR
jgi:hypothetical protein